MRRLAGLLYRGTFTTLGRVIAEKFFECTYSISSTLTEGVDIGGKCVFSNRALATEREAANKMSHR